MSGLTPTEYFLHFGKAAGQETITCLYARSVFIPTASCGRGSVSEAEPGPEGRVFPDSEPPGPVNFSNTRVDNRFGCFYTKYLGFQAKPGATANFAILSRGNLELVLSTPFGPGGAAKPMSDGRKAEPGGWNRIIISVNDLAAEVANLHKAQLHFRNEIVSGPGGSEILLDDPSGNPVELFQAAR